MKTLSVKAPWGWLICNDIKDVENRTFQTKFRGRVLIHISEKEDIYQYTPNQMKYLTSHCFQKPGGFKSAIIGSVEIVDCVQDHPSIWAEHGTIKRFSKSKNRIVEKPIYNWVLASPVLFPEPILNVKGKLSFWEYPKINSEFI